MTSERQRHIERLLGEARSIPPGARLQFVRDRAAGDESLRREVEALLEQTAPTTTLPTQPPLAAVRMDYAALEGHTFSHYKVVRRLAGGGMGVVYEAIDTRLDRRVALKFVAPHLTGDDRARQRFVQEAKAASALDHPHICTIHEIDTAPNGQLFISMAFYDGETLRRRIERGPLPVREALEITIQAARGLVKAHAAGIVHRDIKPANLIVTNDGLVKVIDFGIAKLAGVTGATETGAVVGTAGYMAPELLEGCEADEQSDVWSLGAVLCEMLTGRPAFAGENGVARVHAIRNRTPDSPRAIRPDLMPADVERLALRALEKSREARYRSAAELLKDAESCYDALTRPSTPGLISRGERRRIFTSVVAVAALLVAATLGIGAWLLVNRPAGLRSATREAIPQIEQYAEAGEWEAAYALAKKAQTAAPRHEVLARLWPRFSWLLTIPSDPPGAKVFRRAYSAPGDQWEELGTTPLEGIRFPYSPLHRGRAVAFVGRCDGTLRRQDRPSRSEHMGDR